MKSATISTHVLDTARGVPAEGVRVSAYRGDVLLGQEVTGADGRVAELLGEGAEPGPVYLVFEVGDYFGGRDHLFHRVGLEIDLEGRHHHIPLLLSPFGVTSYRGS